MGLIVALPNEAAPRRHRKHGEGAQMDIEIVRRRIEAGNKMTTKPMCGKHNVLKEWQQITFEYREGEISIRVPHVYAWICPQDGEASFTPETVDELLETVRELIEIAKRARNRRSVLTEYIVSVA